jgi:cysteine synthase A
VIAQTILDVIGGTPHLRINRLFDSRVQVWMKLERSNPGGSIKDRIALAMIDQAERDGVLKGGDTVIEPTSGNTGIGLAMVCAVRRHPLVLVMPESMSVERRAIMAAYGATFELTPRELGMKGAIARAEAMVKEHPRAWMPSQFDNAANIRIHRETTAREILQDFPGGLDYLITGVGTGGHITACGELLKPHFPTLKVLAVEPAASPVISGGKPGPHPLQGIGAGFIPVNLHTGVLDGVVTVEKDEAFAFAARCAREEGVLVGISSGAALAAVAKTIPSCPPGSRILTFCYDTGERYLSIEGLFGQAKPA